MVLRPMTAAEVGDDLLEGFERHQVSDAYYRYEAGRLELRREVFIDDWNEEEKQQKIARMRQCLEEGGALSGAFLGNKLVGFALVAGPVRQGGVALDKIHVSRPMRRRGLGRGLFGLACEAARRMGASYLFIATNPAQATQLYYRAMGCRLAPELTAVFPLEDSPALPLRFNLRVEGEGM